MRRKTLGIKPTGKKFLKGERSGTEEIDQAPKTRGEIFAAMYMRYGCPEILRINMAKTGEKVVLLNGVEVTSDAKKLALNTPITRPGSTETNDNEKSIPLPGIGKKKTKKQERLEEAEKMLAVLSKEYMR